MSEDSSKTPYSSSDVVPASIQKQQEGRFVVGKDGKITDQYSGQFVSAEKSAITKCIQDSVWPKKKWIIKERELDWGSKLQKCVCSKQKIPESSAKSYWEDNKEEVRRRLIRKRNNVLYELKKKMISEWLGGDAARLYNSYD